MQDPIDGKSVLVTGGTGSFGKRFIETILRHHNPARVFVFSRDELKQHEMRSSPPFDTLGQDKLRYFVGNIRDRPRLMQAFRGVDVVIHAAALKQVPACEYNPFEAVKTNVIGAENIIDVAIELLPHPGTHRAAGPGQPAPRSPPVHCGPVARGEVQESAPVQQTRRCGHMSSRVADLLC